MVILFLDTHADIKTRISVDRSQFVRHLPEIGWPVNSSNRLRSYRVDIVVTAKVARHGGCKASHHDVLVLV